MTLKHLAIFPIMFLSLWLSGQDYLLNGASNNSTINTCTGTFYDSGGAAGDYSSFEALTMTFCSDNGTNLCFYFSEFILEYNVAINANYDKFFVYDGPSTASPQLANSPFLDLTGEVISSSGTCLTFFFDSDATQTRAGWTAEISCGMPCQAMVALPIELLSFDATCEAGITKLNWSTASEINNDKFIVARSTDGLSYDAIGSVMGAGNSSTSQHYDFIDDTPSADFVYYQLTQVDFDGTASTFLTTATKCEANLEFQLLPNPAADNFEIMSIPYMGLVQVNIYDATGQLVFEDAYLINHSDSNSIEIDSRALEMGLYTLIVSQDGRASSQKLSILR